MPTERQALVASVLLGLWICFTVPVSSQEAYYWSYAQHPDLSYFDHPPMVAYLIWIGTALFSNGAIGIRLGTLACGIGVTLVGLSLLRSFGGTPPSRLLWIAMGFGVPMYATLHMLANPDPPLCLFSALTLLYLWRARDGRLCWWLLAGLAAGLALLSKYSAVFLAIGGILVLVFDPTMRAQLRRPGPWLAVLIAATTFLPVLIWNAQHDFVSFYFQTGGRLEKARFGVHWLREFAAGQFGVFNPGLALLLPFVLVWLWRLARSGDTRARWLIAFGLPLPLFCLMQSLRLQVKINWLLPAYLPLCIGTVLWWTEGAGAAARPRLCAIAKWTMLVVLFAVPLAPVLRLFPQSRGSTWSGWDQIGAAALKWQQTIAAEGKPVFFFGSDYKDSAQLARALVLLGSGKLSAPVMAQNVFGEPALEFDFWEQPTAHIGENAIFVLALPERRPRELNDAKARFTSVEAVEHVEIQTLGIHVLDAEIYACRGYRGPKL